MKKQLVIIGIIVILVTVRLSGCTTEEDKFIGTWKGIDTNSTVTLHSDGTAVTTNGHGTWSIKDGKLFIKGTNSSSTILLYKFSNGDRTLILTNINGGTPGILIKQ